MSLQPRIVKESELDEKLDAAIKKSLCLCFPHNKEVFLQTRYWHNSVPVYSALIEDGDNIIAHVSVIDRIVKVGDKKCRVAGVQNVFVLPEYRGKGLSDTVLKTAMAEAKRKGFDFGLLFTGEKNKKVYARNGWVQINEQKFIRIEDGREIERSPEAVNMYYPVRKKVFPAGTVNLQGNDW